MEESHNKLVQNLRVDGKIWSPIQFKCSDDVSYNDLANSSVNNIMTWCKLGVNSAVSYHSKIIFSSG